MSLHPSVRAYFEADEKNDAGAPLHVFSPDATVTDDGHTQTGHAAIDAWWRAVKAKYQAVAEPLEAEATADTQKVRAKATGQFSGSPVVLTFAFRIENHKIAALEIGL